MKYPLKLMLILLTLFSSYVFAAPADVRICKSCTTEDSFYAYAKTQAKFNKTILFHIYNPNTDVLKKFQATMRQQILPNGEILFQTFSAQHAIDQQLRSDISQFLVKKAEVGDQFVAQMKRFQDLGTIDLPESIAKSPWDMVGRTYAVYDMTNYFDPRNPNSAHYLYIDHSKAFEFATYVSMAFNSGMTDVLFESFPLNTITVRFASGATMSLEYRASNFLLNITFAIQYPILDSNGNVVANSPQDLTGANDFTGSYRFNGDFSIDRDSFESLLRRSNWEVVSGGAGSGGGLVCRTTHVGDNTTITCSKR